MNNYQVLHGSSPMLRTTVIADWSRRVIDLRSDTVARRDAIAAMALAPRWAIDHDDPFPSFYL